MYILRLYSILRFFTRYRRILFPCNEWPWRYSCVFRCKVATDSAAMAYGGMALFALSQGKALRGAIDIGLGTKLSNGEVYGSVSLDVYELESKAAQYPRIVIGHGVIDFLQRFVNKANPSLASKTDKDIEVCVGMKENLLKMLVYDFDKVVILDYLGETLRTSLTNTEDAKNCFPALINNAVKFIETEYAKRMNANRMELGKKYGYLLNYFKKSGCK